MVVEGFRERWQCCLPHRLSRAPAAGPACFAAVTTGDMLEICEMITFTSLSTRGIQAIMKPLTLHIRPLSRENHSGLHKLLKRLRFLLKSHSHLCINYCFMDQQLISMQILTEVQHRPLTGSLTSNQRPKEEFNNGLSIKCEIALQVPGSSPRGVWWLLATHTWAQQPSTSTEMSTDLLSIRAKRHNYCQLTC